ncbi:uncharacterized protein LOC133927654 [Phragmites australis]|uniref:uncharacterized protein LOC133927654 n=1 Tax=Phragmites australis TaxID=29695 RepID=UPI002D780A3F|nr:uncharacterized protein LOC133927654 [Phragmites australis]
MAVPQAKEHGGATGCKGGHRVKGGAGAAAVGVPKRLCSFWARRGPSPRPSPSQAPKALPKVLGSAREVIGRLEEAVAAERAELEGERVALGDEKGRLEEARKLLETHRATARTAYERSMQELAVEWEALEEAREEAVVAQEEVVSREEAVGKREEAVRSAQADLYRQADDLERGRTDVLRREEQVTLRETDADLASSALAAGEENVANQEVGLIAREQAIKARVERVEQARIEVAAQLQEVWAAKDVPASTADGKSLEARLKKAVEDLNAVHEERTNVKAMMQDALWRAQDSVEAAWLGFVFVGAQGLETLGHLALGFSKIARRLEALPTVVQELATWEGRALGQGVAENVLACYYS